MTDTSRFILKVLQFFLYHESDSFEWKCNVGGFIVRFYLRVVDFFIANFFFSSMIFDFFATKEKYVESLHTETCENYVSLEK